MSPVILKLWEQAWEQNTDLVLGALAAFDFVLGIYILSKFRSLFKQKVENPEKKILMRLIRESQSGTERDDFIKSYDQQGFAKEDVAALYSSNKTVRIKAIRRISALGATPHLFEVKRLLDDKNDTVALYAFKAVVKNQSNAINLALIQRIITRSVKNKTLLAGSLLGIAKSNNYKVLMELLATEINNWTYIFCLKSLVKASVPERTSLLVDAQEKASEEVQKIANILLAEISATDTAVAEHTGTMGMTASVSYVANTNTSPVIPNMDSTSVESSHLAEVESSYAEITSLQENQVAEAQATEVQAVEAQVDEIVDELESTGVTSVINAEFDPNASPTENMALIDNTGLAEDTGIAEDTGLAENQNENSENTALADDLNDSTEISSDFNQEESTGLAEDTALNHDPDENKE